MNMKRQKKKENLFLQAFFAKVTVRIAFLVLCLFILAAVLAPVLAPYDPYAISLPDKTLGPSLRHIFGTDSLGRDLFSRMLYGARVSLSISLVSVFIGGFTGMVLGMTAGYFGGIVDSVICRCADALISIPSIILTIAIGTALGQSNVNIMIAVGISSIPGNIRMMRSTVLSVRERDYITSVRVLGSGTVKLMFKHIVPNCISPLIISCAMGLGGAIMAESSLSFLGIGIKAPTPAWGSMVSEGMKSIATHPWLSIIPGCAIMLIVLSFNLVGDALRDALDPRIRGNA